MKKKKLFISMVIFMLLMSPLFTTVLNARVCLICGDTGNCYASTSEPGSNACSEWHGQLSFCFAWGGGCVPEI